MSNLKAVGYCRTSGEGQRDNTSIPTQVEDIEGLIKSESWSFQRHYVDESKTGSKIEGRDQFQQMMRDAANDNFDIVVVFDISRFARDGFDIMESARTLKRDFGVDVVDCKGQYDTRKPGNTLINFVHAGVAENERLTILERTTRGRISTAKSGKPWTGNHPIGRAYDKATGKWYLTEKGKNLAKVLKRYLDGESLTTLCQEFGLGRSGQVSDWVKRGQLSGTFHATITAKELGIYEEIPIPGMPQIVPASVLAKVKKRLLHRRTYNRVDVKKYPLSGFVRCAKCGRSLTGCTSKGNIIYFHHKTDDCPHTYFRGDLIEPAILDYLFSFFLDEPAFNEAVQRAMPSADRRKELVQERKAADKRLVQNGREIQRLIDAVKQGADVSLLLDEQEKLKEEKTVLANRLRELETDLATLPSVEQTEAAAMLTRLHLTMKYKGRDWRKMNHEDIQRFLFHLFGEQTSMAKTGAFVMKDEKGRVSVTFKGQVEFPHEIVNGHSISEAMKIETDLASKQIIRELDKAMQSAYAKRDEALKALGKQPQRPLRDPMTFTMPE